jgi:hypothetical protein
VDLQVQFLKCGIFEKEREGDGGREGDNKWDLHENSNTCLFLPLFAFATNSKSALCGIISTLH